MNRIIITFFTVLTLNGFQILCAQETAQNMSEVQDETVEPVKNVIYFELFGNGGVYSLNYERRVTSIIWMRSGFSKSSIFGDNLTAPLTASYVFGGSTISLETGVGFTLFYGELSSGLLSGLDIESDGEKGLDILPTGIVGLRFQPDTHNLFMKLAFTPIYDRFSYISSVGFSVGYSF